jgi:hypothetical protein
LASRRRRRKSIGKVIVDVERRVRRVEKRPGAKRLKTNVVTTEKLGYRAVTTKVIQVDAVATENIATDAVTANEAAFGVTVVSDTDPAITKEGTTVVDPTTGSTKVYSTDIDDFVTLTDPAAQASADSKNATYYQDNEPTGGTYEVGDMWVDTDDNNKLYTWDGTDWVLTQDSATAQATADGKAKTYVQDNEPTGGAYNIGDLWIDTNDGNKLYRYNGTAWVSAQDGAISTAQSTANGKNKVYYDTAAPGSTPNTAGDIWWQYASGIVIAQFVGGGGTTWTSAPIGNAVIANLDAGKITTGFLDVAGTVAITTDKTKSGNQARIEINSLGFFAYNGTTTTVSITNSGTALFTGSITGSTITGGTIRTSATGRRIEITTASSGAIYFYDGNSSYNGIISATDYGMYFYGPGSDLGLGARMQLYSDQNPLSSLAGLAAIQAGGTGDVTLTTTTNVFRIDGASTTVSLTASTPIGTYGLRNIRGFTTFDPATNSSGVDGDIAVVYS